MKYKIYLIITVILALLLYGCSSSGESGIKSVKVSEFTDLIFEDDVFVPNTGFAWNMSEDDFLSKVHGADMIDPDGENFDEYRYFHSKETNITTFTPPVTYRIDQIPVEAEAAFAFNENGLFQVGYAWVFKDSETDQADKAIAALVKDINANENMTESQFEIPSLSNMNTDDFPYTYRWSLAEPSQGYVEMGVFKMKEHVIVQLTAGIS